MFSTASANAHSFLKYHSHSQGESPNFARPRANECDNNGFRSADVIGTPCESCQAKSLVRWAKELGCRVRTPMFCVTGGAFVTVIVGSNEAIENGLTEVSPIDLFSDPTDALMQTGRVWFVLHTKSRQEKAVADQLQKFKIKHFLPIIEIERRYGHRTRLIEKPLFPSYVFMHGTTDERVQALSTNRLANVIEVRDQALLVRELKQVQKAVGAGITLDPYAFLHVGHWVRVRSGPLMGLEGRVEDRRHAHRLVLQIETLGQAMSLEIDADLLEPMD